MHIGGLLVGIFTFLIIGAFHGVVAVLGVTCLWSIKELFEQEERVKKGWFPANPKRKK